MHATRGFAIALVATLLAGTLVAQWPPDSGTRVRVFRTAERFPAEIGTFVRATDDTIFIRNRHGALRGVALSRGLRWGVSVGSQSHVLAGMGIGLLSGAAVGAVVGLAAASRDRGFSRGGLVATGAMLFGIPGALIGAIAGSARSDRWQRVGPVDGQVAIAATGVRGAAVRLSFRF